LQEKIWRSLARKCSQRGVALPLLWDLVVDNFIGGLNENGCYTVGCVDDIALLIHGKFLNTVSELLQEALSMIQQWCARTQLSVISKDGDSTIHPVERLSDLKKPTVWTHLVTDYRGHIPWTYYGKGIDMEGSAEKSEE
jgi:hypothetical protein